MLGLFLINLQVKKNLQFQENSVTNLMHKEDAHQIKATFDYAQVTSRRTFWRRFLGLEGPLENAAYPATTSFAKMEEKTKLGIQHLRRTLTVGAWEDRLFFCISCFSVKYDCLV